MFQYGSDLKGATRLPAPAYEQVGVAHVCSPGYSTLPLGPQPNLASPERGADAESAEELTADMEQRHWPGWVRGQISRCFPGAFNSREDDLRQTAASQSTFAKSNLQSLAKRIAAIDDTKELEDLCDLV